MIIDQNHKEEPHNETKSPDSQRKVIRISVRALVEFILRGGDIDNRRLGGAERDAMQAGSRIHRKIQKRMGANYRAEVSLKHTIETERYQILIEGRADGVFTERLDLEKRICMDGMEEQPRPGDEEEQVRFSDEENQPGSGNEMTFIDEIKGIYQDVNRLKEPVTVHLAQALCYGYMYSFDHGLDRIGIQITYCNMETEEIRRFRYEKTFEELSRWFGELAGRYRKWADYLCDHEAERTVSLKGLRFPYPYREGQKELAVSVYRAVSRGKNLFIQAPTGIGKTLSTVYPSLKAIGEGHGEKLFYLTAKTITRAVAEECFSLLREGGMCFTTVTITAKEKLCPMERTECDPDACPFAKGHFDRVNDAVFEIIHREQLITREVVLHYAEEHQVCPFEFCLDISSWADGIICDYNYVFDPNVRLKRYFSENTSGGYLFLIDEAHNLVSRAREMYSALLVKEDFLAVKRLLHGKAPKVERKLARCNRNLLEMKRECGQYQLLEDADLFAANVQDLFGEMEQFLDDDREFDDRDAVLDFYFELRHFLNMYAGLDDHYRIYTELAEDGSFRLRLFCIDPSRCLAECLERGSGSVFFSATLLPVLYYKKLLSGNPEDYAVYAHSPFPAENRMLLIGSDVSSRYTRRNQAEYRKVVDYIRAVAASHKGNYMVFFPSYRYMEAVERELAEAGDDSFTWRMQGSRMNEAEREKFLEDFSAERDRSFVALCVLGGIFSEGIDLKAERLEGAVIVGTGLPMVCTEQEILRGYFEERQENGYDYAYQFPGMNKVMQAAGRVIRTLEDRGIILLLDDRFLRPEVQALFPREWSEYAPVTRSTVSSWLARFWERQAGSGLKSPGN